jgi:hypothetical protein
MRLLLLLMCTKAEREIGAERDYVRRGTDSRSYQGCQILLFTTYQHGEMYTK